MFCCPHPGWTTQAEEMASLEVQMTNIMDRMTRMEAEMVTKDEVMEVLRAALNNKDQRIVILEDALETLAEAMKAKHQRISVLENALDTLKRAAITNDVFRDAFETRDIHLCELEEEMKSLTGRITVTEETDLLLRGMVDQVRNPPFAFQCAWRYTWYEDNSVITYDRLIYDEISGGSGGLDINTGVFTVGSGFSGVWAVTYSMMSNQNSGDINLAWLYINGEKFEESVLNTYYNGSEGHVESLGSRTLYIRLEAGDTLSLRTGSIWYLYQISLCFQLVQFDDVPPM